VFDRISTYLWSKFDIDALPSYLSVRLPRHVPLPIRFAMVDLFFVCLILSGDMEGFLDDVAESNYYSSDAHSLLK